MQAFPKQLSGKYIDAKLQEEILVRVSASKLLDILLIYNRFDHSLPPFFPIFVTIRIFNKI
ncbi:hypothetical protein [Belliella calami]|uniref:hypothetical protein n=1 Tax=Belliella calami TaxID=2923436 RepID=UPI001F4B8ABD|nr:hypothetical protein [Belliella calami]